MVLLHCSQGNAGSLGGCEATHATRRPYVVVVIAPCGQHPPCMGRTTEDGLVQTRIAQPPDEALDEPVLMRLARRDGVPVHIVLLAPPEDRHARRFGAVMPPCGRSLRPAHHEQRSSADSHDCLQFTNDTSTRQRRVGDQRQTLAAEIIDDGQDPEAPPIAEGRSNASCPVYAITQLNSFRENMLLESDFRPSSSSGGQQVCRAHRGKPAVLGRLSSAGERASIDRWRRGWDSNPRYRCRYSGFRDRPDRPLWHPSGPGRCVHDQGPARNGAAAGKQDAPKRSDHAMRLGADPRSAFSSSSAPITVFL